MSYDKKNEPATFFFQKVVKKRDPTKHLSYFSSSIFFDKLKEKRIESGVGRAEKSEYKEGYTAALAMQLSDHELSAKKENYAQLLRDSEDAVIEHAARRVDLFFYTLVAYYKTNICPIQDTTVMQHGDGRKSLSVLKRGARGGKGKNRVLSKPHLSSS